jgi:hypothetical protein
VLQVHLVILVLEVLKVFKVPEDQKETQALQEHKVHKEQVVILEQPEHRALLVVQGVVVLKVPQVLGVQKVYKAPQVRQVHLVT